MEQDLDIFGIAGFLASVAGVVGVVLGGSRARGTNGPDSDYDVGVYYSDITGLDVGALAAIAADLDDECRADLIAPPGAWGNWVNGGGWLTVDGRRVDILLRDARRVERSVADCLAGNVHAHYQTGHPHAYINIMYAGELAIAKILHDESGFLRGLQGMTTPYPGSLKKAIFDLFGFEAGFSLMLGEVSAKSGDEYYVAAHIIRSLSCLNQTLFAVNGEYCINEKKAVGMIDGFPLKPEKYAFRVNKILAYTARDNRRAFSILKSLIDETRALLS